MINPGLDFYKLGPLPVIPISPLIGFIAPQLPIDYLYFGPNIKGDNWLNLSRDQLGGRSSSTTLAPMPRWNSSFVANMWPFGMVNVDVSCMPGVYVEEITKKRNDDLLKGGGFKGFFNKYLCISPESWENWIWI